MSVARIILSFVHCVLFHPPPSNATIAPAPSILPLPTSTSRFLSWNAVKRGRACTRVWARPRVRVRLYLQQNPLKWSPSHCANVACPKNGSKYFHIFFFFICLHIISFFFLLLFLYLVAVRIMRSDISICNSFICRYCFGEIAFCDVCKEKI
jgi:hypothetical protein